MKRICYLISIVILSLATNAAIADPCEDACYAAFDEEIAECMATHELMNEECDMVYADDLAACELDYDLCLQDCPPGDEDCQDACTAVYDDCTIWAEAEHNTCTVNAIQVLRGCGWTADGHLLLCLEDCVTPTEPMSWGEIKSRYR